jgi:hypothetical protein
MKLTTFWTILLKILGLWFMFVSLATIFQLLSMFVFTSLNGNSQGIGKILIAFAIVLLAIMIFIFIVWLLVFKTGWIIERLRLTNDFTEDKLELTMEWSAILTIATIVIGGVIFIDSFPLVFKESLTFIQRGKSIKGSPESIWILYYLVRTVLGYLLMTNSRFVANFIGRQNDKTKNSEINDSTTDG